MPAARSNAAGRVGALFAAACDIFQSTAQTYGYDDMDTPGNVTDDHVSVKIKATTYIHVKIDGGTSTDVEFVCDNTSVAQPGAAPAGANLIYP